MRDAYGEWITISPCIVVEQKVGQGENRVEEIPMFVAWPLVVS